MHRAGASKAGPTTLCQKCLKIGHYSYECTGSQQDRPYNSRPSRTQQLFNPKLAPKLSNTKLVEPAPSIPADLKKEEWQEKVVRRRLPSVASSKSVSTISTGRSRSLTPEPRRNRSRERRRKHYDSSSSEDDADRRRRPLQKSRRSTGSLSPRPAARCSLDRTERHAGKSPGRDRDRSRSPYRSDEHRNSLRAVRERPHLTSTRQRSLSPYSKRLAMNRR